MSLRYLLLLLVGCAPVTAPEPSVPGRYELVSVNGGGLPVVLQVVPPEVVRLQSESYVFYEGGTFADTQIVHFDQRPFGPLEVDTIVHGGTWSVGDSVVMLARDDQQTVSLIWRGNDLERFVPRQLPMLDLTLRYRKH